MQPVSISPFEPPRWKVKGPVIRVHETFSATVRYRREEIMRFAELCGDASASQPARLVAQRATFGEIFATDQQTAARMMGAVATHFADGDDGIAREVLCLNFNFAFRRPIFAEQDVHIHWRVRDAVASATRGGYIGNLDGQACVGRRVCVVGRGTVAIRQPGDAPA